MRKKDITPNEARNETEIFTELQKLCCSPGYIHAIAYFCWRDNLIRFAGDQITEDDVQHQYSHAQLLRSEISTLIGLMAKGNIDTSIPKPATLQNYIDQSEALLHEMHMSLQKPWLAAFEVMARNPGKANHIDPFSTAEGLREPIFYGGESAYNFQYEELALRKYSADGDWLGSHVGFSIDEACIVARKLGELQMQKLLGLREAMLKLHPDQWTFLPGFVFGAHELEGPTGFSFEKIERILVAFIVDPKKANASFSSLSAFNETNAAPIIKAVNGSYILLQHYSLLEALYEAPFFWMAADKSYAATASKNRGAFAEQFLADRFICVFGPQHVFQNVDIYKGKDRVTEADVLVVYGDRAIVVQAKSKRLTIEARKGNDLQLKDDFKKAIHDAYDQALLCSEALLDQEYRFVLPSGDEIGFPKRPAKIFPVCSVSDHFPALAAQARQFLKVRATDNVQPPVITDVFFLDVLTEILETPLHFLNYLALRAKFDKRLLVNQELTNLGYHLKHNLWLEDQYDMVNLGDDFTSSLDIAMSARRLGVPGERTPKGILTRFDGTPIGKLISEFETSAIPELVGLGMLFLQLGSDTAKHINRGIDRLVRSAADDGQPHDISFPSDADKSGFTIHVNSLLEEVARERLSAHCRIRKYDTKSDVWYGLLLAPGTGDIRGALAIEGNWKADANMEKALAAWPKKPMVPVKTLSRGALRKKIGRNEPCPCGSGKKYKRCCLDRS
ncbi:MAG: prepilin peptidase [Mesorhizobium sp.]|uniref:nuclease-related domain-containing protein n=1 Tax=Mesorhizobium sp. TaxID=1871066 RepID=UPI000FE892DB|nr:nuclease-related domain-containing protein [Mesorhizobium sp.]RWH78769.1 MAG: prepilin peptidase [Mesorhizobium sp.]RWH81607.1 MAG: prepilin peptidase [Mesorhizobium sp.]RWH90207.1 MAG: prepilin peptidase [Mesorhizobium sp.]RWH97944.1 MAG: prepilin peptidase [Mesorhizobium sp.]RWI00230.1 MAG: prepilin peptidase [Mesorhizobium sp.]